MEELKKLVEFVRYQKYSIDEYQKRYTRGDREDCNRMLEEVANRLERREKFEKIVQELEEEVKARNNFFVPEEYLAKQGGVMEYLIKELKKKYFPLFKKTVTIKFETEDEDVVNCCIRIIKKRLEEYSDSIHIDYKVEED